MEPITLFAIYTFGLIIGGVGLGYYLDVQKIIIRNYNNM